MRSPFLPGHTEFLRTGFQAEREFVDPVKLKAIPRIAEGGHIRATVAGQ
jgi:hypothetical protein